MKRNTLNSVLLLTLLAFLLAACKTKKKVVVVVPPVTDTVAVDRKKSETLQLLQQKDVAFTSLSLKGKAILDINGLSNNVNMNIRIRKDEAIWVSVTGLMGIEGARALITPDSIKVLNKLQGVYLKKPFNYVHRFSNKQVNFKMLQAILSGNTIGELMTESSDLQFENGVWVLQGEQAELGYRVLFNTLLKVSESNLNDLKSWKALKVVYGDYQNMNGTLFPTTLSINSMAGTQKINLKLDFSKVESNVPVEFPFNVPGKYEVIN
jgi:outer membrane biogenesis lipoprotein LolB